MPGTRGPPAKTGSLAIPPLGLYPANIHRLQRRDQAINPDRNGHRAPFSDELLANSEPDPVAGESAVENHHNEPKIGRELTRRRVVIWKAVRQARD